MSPPDPNKIVLALDVGDRRVGLAIGNMLARLAHPLKTLLRGPDFISSLKAEILRENVSSIVVGLPRNLDGNDTYQTTSVREFAHELQQIIDLPLHFQDEALTSHQAKSELVKRGLNYQKSDVDALAATYILEDFFKETYTSAGKMPI